MKYEDLINNAIKYKETDIDTIILDELNKFPHEIFEIKSLESLFIDEWLKNFDVKEKDFDKLAELKNLRRLSLIDNGLNFIPRQIFELAQLEELIIFGNNIRKIPYGITECVNLKNLHIASNQIEDLPDFVLSLKNLEVLEVGGNPLRAIPRRIDFLSNLKSLHIDNSRIKSLPVEILNLELEEFEPDNTLLEIIINDSGWMPMSGKIYIKERLEYYFLEYKVQFKKKLKQWLANNQINKVFEVLTSEIPELAYYDTPKEIVLASSRFRHIELESRRGTINFETAKLELNKVIISLIEIIEEL